jgi:hypothetical protein
VDTSDVVFTITPTPFVTLTSPNGGESLEGGTVQNITWNSVGTSGSVKIDYSADGGVTWSDITVSTADDGTEPWTVPNDITTTALVRVSDLDDDPTDQSNQVFNIVIVTEVTLQEGVNGYSGTRDTRLLATNPGINYGNAIRVTVDGGGQSASESTLLFWDLTNIPLGSTIDSVEITLNVSNSSSESYEFYEINRNWTENEATWNSYATDLDWEIPGAYGSGDRDSTILGTITPSSSGLNTISLNTTGVAVVQTWINNPSSNHGFILADSNNTNGADFSSRETSTISNRPMITLHYTSHTNLLLTSPNGSESWEAGSVQNLAWSSAGTSGSVNIDYSIDNGVTWSNIFTSTSDDGIEPWMVPNLPTTQALLRVSDSDGNGPLDISDGIFTITPSPTLTVMAPNGGESWEGGSVQNITWNSISTSGTVKIEYSADGGVTWSGITVSTPDTGSFPWTVPDTSTSQVLIRINDTDGNGPGDISDAVFEITPTPFLTIISPNGGEIWEVDSTQNITWTAIGTSGTVRIEYSGDNGASWSEIMASAPDTGSYPWTVPDSSISQALVRISDTDGNGPSDISNAIFIITSLPVLVINTPNGGESLEGGSVQNVNWNSVGTSGIVKIEYSADNGASWSEITASTPDTGSYSWIIPDTSTTSALIAISDTDGNGPIDTSEVVFTITPTPVLAITSPNEGESWEGGSLQNIFWHSTNTSGNVKIEFSAG